MFSDGPPHIAEQKQGDQQLCGDTGCSSDDLPEAMNVKEEWREKTNIFQRMIWEKQRFSNSQEDIPRYRVTVRKSQTK